MKLHRARGLIELVRCAARGSNASLLTAPRLRWFPRSLDRVIGKRDVGLRIYSRGCWLLRETSAQSEHQNQTECGSPQMIAFTMAALRPGCGAPNWADGANRT